jgi:L-alanine-DL-glutamate epimerase-like enolase superfamily enzyme
LEILHLTIPLREPFSNAGSSLRKRDVGLIKASRGEFTGWGEASPFPGQDESFASMVTSASAGRPSPVLAGGMDQAQCDLNARMASQRLAATRETSKDALPISLAVGVGPGAIEAVGRAVTAGIGRFKLKVAPGSVTHVRSIRDRFPDAVLGVDGNASFSVETMGELAELADLNLAYMEEPVVTSDTELLDGVRSVVDAPIFADESVRSATDIEQLAMNQHVDGVVIKPGRLGFTGALEAVDLAEGLGLRWRASGLLETSVGRAYTNALASLPNAFVSDVAPADWFLERDVASTMTRDGSVILPEGPGIGFDPDEEVLADYLVERNDLTHLLEP